MSSPGLADATSIADDFAATVRHLTQRLARRPLPGNIAQVRMAPAYRMDPAQASVAGKECREAGVLVLLYPSEADGRPTLVLTERQDHLDDHGGQVSFPGGQREAVESLEATALREAHEEVALDPQAVDILGPLTPLYIPPSGFCVHPFVGVARAAPALHPADAEVAALLHVPLAALLAPAALQREPWTLHGQTVEVPFFNVDGCPPVWGATSMMLSELLALF
jgi:8-oxo-dGTP pyrophosphatase MutT (NUDIX family)